MTRLRQIQVNGLCEIEVWSFLDALNALEPAIESGWNTTLIGHEYDPDEFQGFGYTNLPKKRLNRLAYLLNVKMVCIGEPLNDETRATLGLTQQN